MTGAWRQVFTADDPRGPWPARKIVQAVEQLREWSASSDEWAELCDLQYRISDVPTGDEQAACYRMAKLLDSHADRMERSRLVRAFTTFTPESLRADAAEFRAGRNPYAGPGGA
ncbi:hypothetical protein AMIS_20160 [Actinoplanes missouriensis 431]|uniref:Uncharacterized protein n=1 Tax=Actinoplanes missouriensis (strain ATCC 14538 / DSM 43046 / CBS 188.64 / JCM 3121 / NBRC 102363 / NCIMB 12654 / NRRL B-3342 / UNCC 431) TaxID=512565 RepID=I0H2J9_ACTM4|nr:hypothetical protein [Actinoplanes missouriensis]BAL87236.1 hypothetical protein AMIS_20160 [Actinoplanes missouriensis 431]